MKDLGRFVFIVAGAYLFISTLVTAVYINDLHERVNRLDQEVAALSSELRVIVRQLEKH